MILNQRYFNTEELAELLRVKKNTIDRWRVERTCPFPWTKICGRVLYERDEVMSYLESQKRNQVNLYNKQEQHNANII